jgi:hypothetical protein
VNNEEGSIQKMISSNKTPQWGGAAFMLGSVLFLTNKLNEMSRLFLSRWMPDMISGQNTLLIVIGQVALIIGFVAYFRLYGRRVGRFGKNALRLFCGGGILLAVGHVSFMPILAFEPLFLSVIIGLGAVLVGLILFGIANLRQPILGRWQWLPLATGLIGSIGFFLFGGEEITAVFLLFRTLFSLGLFGLGLTLWLEKPVQPEVAR